MGATWWRRLLDTGDGLAPLVLRVAPGLVFVSFSVGKFTRHAAEAAAFERYGVPLAEATVYLVGLLELIGEHGSISRAAREMKMSYRRAGLLAGEVNRMFSEPVLETQHGGVGGGHARLTSFGHALVGHYRAIETQALKSFGKQIGDLERRLRPAEKVASK